MQSPRETNGQGSWQPIVEGELAQQLLDLSSQLLLERTSRAAVPKFGTENECAGTILLGSAWVACVSAENRAAAGARAYAARYRTAYTSLLSAQAHAPIGLSEGLSGTALVLAAASWEDLADGAWAAVERAYRSRSGLLLSHFDLFNGHVGVAAASYCSQQRVRRGPLQAALGALSWQLTRRDQYSYWVSTGSPRLPANTFGGGPRCHLGVAHGQAGALGIITRLTASGALDLQATTSTIGPASAWLMDALRQHRGTTHGAEFQGVPLAGETSRWGAAWCAGPLGVSWTLLQAAQLLNDVSTQLLAVDIARQLARVPVGPAAGSGLCHGGAGRALLYQAFFSATHDEVFRAAAICEWTTILQQPDRYPNGGGLFDGDAGVGLAAIAASRDLPRILRAVFLLYPESNARDTSARVAFSDYGLQKTTFSCGLIRSAAVGTRYIGAMPPCAEAHRLDLALGVSTSDLQLAREIGAETTGDEVASATFRAFQRMAYRATPCGTSAAVGRIFPSTTTALELEQKLLRRSRISTAAIERVVKAAVTTVIEPDRPIRLFINDTLYATPDGLRWYASGWFNENEAGLQRINRTPLLDGILTMHRENGSDALTLPVSIAVIGNLDPEGARLVYERLIATELFVPRECRLIGRLDDDGDRRTVSHLQELYRELKEADELTSESALSAYRRLTADVNDLVGAPASIADTIHVDSMRAGDAGINTKVLDEIALTAEILRGSISYVDPRITRFARDFEDKYGERFVPLLTALDPDYGIGFHAVPSIGERDYNYGDEPGQMEWRKILRRVMDRVEAGGVREIVLDERDLPRWPLQEGTYSAMFSLIAASADDVDRGVYRILFDHVIGPSSSYGIGRFACLFDSLADELRRVSHDESVALAPRAVAEIAHRPSGGIGNVIIRPHLRQQYILCLGSVGDDPGGLALANLDVGIVDGEVRLWSPKLEAYIVPRSGTAHNHATSPCSAYAFLGALAKTGLSPSVWNWAEFGDRTFLPRISLGRLVLQRARWRVDAEVLREALRNEKSAERFCTETGLPRYVLVGEEDKLWPADLSSAAARRALSQKARSSVILQELLPLPGECPARLDTSDHVNTEIQILFQIGEVRKRDDVAIPTISAPSDDFTMWTRRWRYVRACCSDHVAERLICNFLPAVESEKFGILDAWHFVRYRGREGDHVRLRWLPCAGGERDADAAFAAWSAQWFEEGVREFISSPFSPEVRRYGGETAFLQTIEEFTIDSEYAARVLSLIRLLESLDDRILTRLLSVCIALDAGFESAGDVLPDRVKTLSQWTDQQSPAAPLRKKCRAIRGMLLALWHEGNARASASDVTRYITISNTIRVRRLARLASKFPNRTADYTARRSVAHMLCNRVLGAEADGLEPVVYHALAQAYRSRIART
jgi:lantibiotic biosynthesis protein